MFEKFIKQELTGWKTWELLWLVFAVTAITILSYILDDTALGITAAVTGVICVILTGKGKISCYLFGLINTMLYAWLSFQMKYYGEVMLNVLYYVPMQFVGWFMWKRHLDGETSEVVKDRLSLKADGVLVLSSAAAILLYGALLKHLGGNLPYLDSVTTCLSVVAMLLSVRRLMEQWVLWIVIDIVTIYLWAAASQSAAAAESGTNYPGMVLMWSVYLLNAVLMFIKWYRESGGRKGEV